MRKVIDLLSNISSDCEVLLFAASLNYKCVEHYPFSHSELVGRTFPDICQMADVFLPSDCNYCFFRFPNYRCTIRENGNYIYIINSKIQFSQNEQDPKNRN